MRNRDVEKITHAMSVRETQQIRIVYWYVRYKVSMNGL